ncbi:MAG: Nif3-like dinuclear metal center hexameric protein [Patescibacteria group bacterium]|nr:Nif3-like dinuclear metal center hexameric protein [Patescibacteria group bacterium]
MLTETKKIIKYCEDYLDVDKFNDGCFNGLQVEGAKKIDKIIVGVSWSEKLIKEAIKKKARLIIVHHGIFKNDFGNKLQLKGFTKNRIKFLLENDINLAGFHLPLDAHRAIGNNISLIKLLKLKKTDVIDCPDYGEIGFIGEYKEAMKFEDFYNLVCDELETQPYVIPAGKKNVKRVGIISGGASPNFKEAAELGADTYICGDAREEVVRAVEETGINFINAGHYNTEKIGIQNLGKLIAKKFKIKVEFVDVPCDV